MNKCRSIPGVLVVLWATATVGLVLGACTTDYSPLETTRVSDDPEFLFSSGPCHATFSPNECTGLQGAIFLLQSSPNLDCQTLGNAASTHIDAYIRGSGGYDFYGEDEHLYGSYLNGIVTLYDPAMDDSWETVRTVAHEELHRLGLEHEDQFFQQLEATCGGPM